MKGGKCCHGVAGVVLGGDGLQANGRTVVQRDVGVVSLGDLDLFHGVEMRDVIGHVKGDFVLLDVTVGAHGFVVVVEGHTGRDDVDEGEAFVRHGCLQQGGQLLL